MNGGRVRLLDPLRGCVQTELAIGCGGAGFGFRIRVARGACRRRVDRRRQGGRCRDDDGSCLRWRLDFGLSNRNRTALFRLRRDRSRRRDRCLRRRTSGDWLSRLGRTSLRWLLLVRLGWTELALLDIRSLDGLSRRLALLRDSELLRLLSRRLSDELRNAALLPRRYRLAEAELGTGRLLRWRLERLTLRRQELLVRALLRGPGDRLSVLALLLTRELLAVRLRRSLLTRILRTRLRMNDRSLRIRRHLDVDLVLTALEVDTAHRLSDVGQEHVRSLTGCRFLVLVELDLRLALDRPLDPWGLRMR